MTAHAGPVAAGGTTPVRRRRLSPDALAELEERRDLLLRALDELEAEHEAGDLATADYEALRDDYTHRAAEAVRAVESGRIAVAERPPVRRGRMALAAAAVVAVAAGAGFAVAGSSGTRDAGELASGEVRQLADDRLQSAAQAAASGDITGALELYDGVLEDDPDNVEAMLERGLLLASLSQAAGRPDLATTGRASVERALDVDPGNPRGLFYLGLIHRLEGDEAASVDALRQALAADPPPVLRRSIEQVLAEAPSGEAAPPAAEDAPATTP